MKTAAVFLLLFVFAPSCMLAQQGRTKNFNLEKGLAIAGYDPVSYFSGKPKEGQRRFSYAYEGITYIFHNEANLQAFKQTPAKYEPQYGGWCAYAMGSSGDKVEIDPETYKVVDGKLFLFYNKYFNNTLKSWNKNEKTLKANADANWAKYK